MSTVLEAKLIKAGVAHKEHSTSVFVHHINVAESKTRVSEGGAITGRERAA